MMNFRLKPTGTERQAKTLEKKYSTWRTGSKREKHYPKYPQTQQKWFKVEYWRPTNH